MDTQTTVRMANQIANFFGGYGPGIAPKEIADHINRFWEPRMRAAFFDHLAAGGEGLSQLVKDAAPMVRRPSKGPAPLREPTDAKTGLPKEASEA